MYFLPRVNTPGLTTPSSITSPYLPRPGVLAARHERQHGQSVEGLIRTPGAGILALLDLLTLQPVERLVGGGGDALDNARLGQRGGGRTSGFFSSACESKVVKKKDGPAATITNATPRDRLRGFSQATS